MDWLSRLHPQATRAASAAQPVLTPRFADVSATDLLRSADTAPGPAHEEQVLGDRPQPGLGQPGRQPADRRAGALSPVAAPLPTQPLPAAAMTRAAPVAPGAQDAAAAARAAALPPAARAAASPRQARPPAPGTDDPPLAAARHFTAPRADVRLAEADLPPSTARPDASPAAPLNTRPPGSLRASPPLIQPTRLPGAGDAAAPAPLVVQVSIDRIEVRAPAPSRASPPARTAAAASQGVSLADYLRGQRSGSRS